MPGKTDADHLRDILEYAEKAVQMTDGRTRAEFDSSSELQCALQYCLVIIGEAAGRVSETGRARLPNLP